MAKQKLLSVMEDSDSGLPNKENELQNLSLQENSKYSYSDSDTDESQNSAIRKQSPKLVTNSDGLKPRRRAKKRSESETTQNINYTLPPHVIARRNERERDRVKQVNNSFALLRSRIPYFAEKGDDANRKKLSKVETLRLAVDYIQHLEVLLNLKEGSLRNAELGDDESSGDQSIFIKSEFIETESDTNHTDEQNIQDYIDDQQMRNYELSPKEMVSEDVVLPSVTIIQSFPTNSIEISNFIYPNYDVPNICAPSES